MTVLAGKVIDAHTGYPLAGVVLGCLGAGTVHYCRSDERGCFDFKNINEGCWQVIASKPPYSEHNHSYCLAGDGYINICLLVEGLDDEVVTA
jgi:hypothetical protein